MPACTSPRDGHQLGGAGERAAELRLEHTQQGGDERTRMADADPEDRVDEENAPVRRAVDSRHAQAFDNHVTP